MGSIVQARYNVQGEAEKVFQEGILHNNLVPSLPSQIREASQLVTFNGNSSPSIPINWRFAESISALKAFEASMLNVLRSKKYDVKLSEVTIDTDHASLFFMSPLLNKVILDGQAKPESFFGTDIAKFGFPDHDKHDMKGHHRVLVTNIYRTKDMRYYHVHGSMNSDPTLSALGEPLQGEADDTYDTVVQRHQKAVEQFNSDELDELMNEKYKQAGTIAWSPEEFQRTEHGKANAHVGLYSLDKIQGQNQPASWWPENTFLPSSPKRPLAGLKVVDLTRVLASPAITRGLAEMGASVMRITASHLTDLSPLHQDLNWGKWNSSLNLKTEEGRAALRHLILEADVVVDGYRPGAMSRNGFGREDIFELVKNRGRGLVYVRENCYGWHGPWAHRSGWQQISDACCGVSMRYGQAMGHDEAVTPVFPNSDFCTGVIGSAATLHALMKRAEEGGSYGVDVSLNYYSQWLVRSVGEYPADVWSELWQRHGSPVFRHYHSMQYTLPAMLDLIAKHDSDVIFNPAFFEQRRSKAVGHTFVQVKPIAQFADDVELAYNVGTRTNGVDQPRWPADLKTEIIT
ncbi:CoA-transferase family III [Teratosphaeria destructans]|uniref:CoA-transferase family III n=1 Tax=Teratosphaeria destructans TaxID=418781 RepID=A0A9W7SL97_9PEZI|nr:CoA-transferase family III [Teratosphaeria destructans]